MLNIIIRAIETRSVLIVNYDGKVRFVEPHAVGKGSKGQLLMRGFQTGGESDSLNFGWKLFLLEKVESLSLATPRAGYNANDSALAEVLAAL